MNMTLLIDMHNAEREKSWWTIPKLSKDAKLMEYAQHWAIEMCADNKLYHSKMTNILRLGFNNVGENIASGQKDIESVMRSWIISPGHRRNIMSKSFSHIGCGYAVSNDGAPYWCVCFGTPSTKKN